MSKTRHKTRHPGIYYRNGSDDPEVQPRRYIVWYADSDGKGRTETLPLGATSKDALVRQGELRGKVSRGERVVPSKLSLEEFAATWILEQEGKLSPASIRTHGVALRHITRAMGRRRLHEVTVDDVADLVARMQREGYKGWTIKRVLSTLSGIMGTARRRGYCAANPVRGLERKERPKNDQRQMRCLTSEEITALLEAVSPYWRTLITTLVFTGMRIGECLSVRWEDVDFDAGLITVRESKTEAGRGRKIVMIPSLGTVLRKAKLASEHSDADDLVFGTKQQGRPLNRANVLRGSLRTAKVRGAVGDLTLHELRHTFASILIGQGFDVTFVADQLGHQTPAITLTTYAKLFDPAARRDEARERLQVAFGGMLS